MICRGEKLAKGDYDLAIQSMRQALSIVLDFKLNIQVLVAIAELLSTDFNDAEIGPVALSLRGLLDLNVLIVSQVPSSRAGYHEVRLISSAAPTSLSCRY